MLSIHAKKLNRLRESSQICVINRLAIGNLHTITQLNAKSQKHTTDRHEQFKREEPRNIRNVFDEMNMSDSEHFSFHFTLV